MAALVTEVKLRQLQVARIRQEDEESWISSEELHTDGSSDDDPTRCHTTSLHHPTRHHRDHHHHHHHHEQHHPQKGGSGPHAFKIGGSTTGPPSITTASMHPPATASEPVTQDAPHLSEATRRLSELGVEPGAPLLPPTPGPHHYTPDDCMVEEQDDIILWRPKRGSIQLPNVDLSSILSTAATADNTDQASCSDTSAAVASSSTSLGIATTSVQVCSTASFLARTTATLSVRKSSVCDDITEEQQSLQHTVSELQDCETSHHGTDENIQQQQSLQPEQERPVEDSKQSGETMELPSVGKSSGEAG